MKSLLTTAALAFWASAMAQTTLKPTLMTLDFPGSTSTQAWAINSRGDIAGIYADAARVNHGFFLSKGTWNTIDYPGAALTLVNNLNNRGDLVGEYATTPTGPHHGFVSSSGRFTTIDFPGATSSWLAGIDAAGDITGGYTSPDNQQHGFLLKAGAYTSFDFPGATQTVVIGMGPDGSVVGGYAAAGLNRAFLMVNGEFTSWEYPGATFTNCVNRNASGELVGRWRDTAGVVHAYLLRNGEYSTFDFPGATFTAAAGVNSSGDIVGRYTLNGVSHAFLWKRGLAPSYAVTDLGTFGGNQSFAYGISEAGWVAGGATTKFDHQHAFLSKDGTLTDLGLLGGANSVSTNPNGAGDVSVTSEISKPDPNGEDFCGYYTHLSCVAAIWSGGKLRQLPTLGGNNAVAFGLNNRGLLVGAAETTVRDPSCPSPQKLAYQATLWGPGPADVQQLRPLPGDTVGWALWVNEKGEAVGGTGSCADTQVSPNGLLFSKHAVLWRRGVPTKVMDDAVAAGINNRSEVTVGANRPDGTVAGLLWNPEDGPVSLGQLGKDPSLLPSVLNDATQITGGSCDTDFNCRAILWDNGSLMDLNDLVPPGSKLYLAFGTSINDAGEIVGWGIDKKSGETHAFVARPVPASGVTAADVAAGASAAVPEEVREVSRNSSLHLKIGARTRRGLR